MLQTGCPKDMLSISFIPQPPYNTFGVVVCLSEETRCYFLTYGGPSKSLMQFYL